MLSDTRFTAVIADDEPLLADSLKRQLSLEWPSLEITALANNGLNAIDAIFKNQPDVVFLDIQMPGANGLEVAQTIAEDWPADLASDPMPLVVFVTAFDDYAIEAFESAAVDYLLKPVRQDRLRQTIGRLAQRLVQRVELGLEPGLEQQQERRQEFQKGEGYDALCAALRELLKKEAKVLQERTESQPLLKVIRASSGNQISIIPLEDVILFESADKYISVHTENGEFVIRQSLKKLLTQLDPSLFEQIHRGAIVNMTKIESAARDDTGRVTLRLKGIDKQTIVSRVYRHLFQPM